MAGKKTGKRLLTWVLVLVMALSLLPLNALAAEDLNAGEKSSGIEFSKEVSKQPDVDKNYTITMDAWATGTTTPTESVKPMDIVLVLDVSGSMDEGFTETTYTEYSSETTNSKFWDVKDNLYFKTDDSSYQKVTLERKATDFTYTAVSPTYNDIRYGEYYVKSNAAADAKRVTIEWYTRGFNTGYYLTIDGHKVGERIGRRDWNNTAVAEGYTFYEETASSYTYTYTYMDDSGDRQSLSSAGNDQKITWTLYARSEVSSTKMSALQSAVNSFIESVGNSSKDHRIAIVKFASDNSDKVGNDFTFWYGYNCSQIVMELTATDKNGVTQLENVVNDLSPAGATRSDYGMGHAKDIINASKAADTDDQRGRVVIMFTDGNPTDHRNFNVTVANGAISAAKDIKDVGAKVYTIGVFGEDPDDRINKYMNRVSSNCPNAFDMSEGGAGADADENAGYYSTAASADDLSRIFSSISSNISEATNKALDGKTEVNDVVSDYFDLATNDVNSIKVYTADRTADGGWADKQLVTDPSVTVALSGKTIKVSGYNYAANYITDEAKSDGTYGQKLIIEIKVKPSGVGCASASIPTNEGNATVTLDDKEINKATPPTVDGYSVEYKIDVDDGVSWPNNEAPEKLYYPKDVTITVTDKVPTREGFEFTGWKSDIEDDDKVYTYNGTNSFTMPAANVILKAQWKKIETPEPTPATVTLRETDANGNALINKHLTITAKEAETIKNAYFCVAVTAADGTTKTAFTTNPRYATTTTVDNMTRTSDGTAVEGSFVFPEESVLTFTEEGPYTFTVKEVFDEHIKVNHTTYDDTEYTMTVNVTKDATENKLNAAVSFTKGEEDPTGSITFNNTYKTPVYDFNLTDLGITVYKNFVSKYGRSATRSFTATATIEKQETYTVEVDPNLPINPYPNNRSAVTAEPTYKEVGEATGTVTLKTDTIKAFDFGKDSKFQLVPGDYRITVEETNCNDRYVNYDTNDTNDTKPHTRYFNVSENGDISPIDSITITNEYTKRHSAATPSKPTLNTGDHYAYVMGYPDGTVRPNGSITRAEVSAILFRLLSDKTRDEYFTTESSFTDVKAGAWYNNSIATLEKAGVIVDTAKGGAFRPNEAITRAELAAMLAQFSDAKPVKGVKFSDVPAEHWAYEAIAIAAKMGWIEGYPDGTFRPDATITRAEMMTLVNRALERVPSDEDHLLSKRVMLTFPDCKSGDWFYIAVQEATNSHTYERAATEKNGDEQWTALRANRDWTLLEK